MAAVTYVPKPSSPSLASPSLWVPYPRGTTSGPLHLSSVKGSAFTVLLIGFALNFFPYGYHLCDQPRVAQPTPFPGSWNGLHTRESICTSCQQMPLNSNPPLLLQRDGALGL